MKELPYITHDFGARNDPKLMDLQMEMGGQGLGIFWCLVEMLWENGGTIPANLRPVRGLGRGDLQPLRHRPYQ